MTVKNPILEEKGRYFGVQMSANLVSDCPARCHTELKNVLRFSKANKRQSLAPGQTTTIYIVHRIKVKQNKATLNNRLLGIGFSTSSYYCDSVTKSWQSSNLRMVIVERLLAPVEVYRYLFSFQILLCKRPIEPNGRRRLVNLIL
jgi:hypothetical protein